MTESPAGIAMSNPAVPIPAPTTAPTAPTTANVTPEASHGPPDLATPAGADQPLVCTVCGGVLVGVPASAYTVARGRLILANGYCKGRCAPSNRTEAGNPGQGGAPGQGSGSGQAGGPGLGGAP
ncbi:hypothetical protein ABZW11_42795 [Nonomuraea sp. NPDC004580]|uniref:hypothetical protein n=1 Tax=Nonomuraea sp. NPDC004580 TaxID=3154552 RepID=UPI0033B03672